MKEYAGMVAAQTAQVLLMIVSKSAIAGGMSNYSFVFYSSLLASLLLPLSLIFHRSVNRPAISTIVVCGFFVIGLLGIITLEGIFGSAFQVTVQAWCVRRKGPFFVAMFHPVGIVISTFIGVVFLGGGFYLGSLMGSIVVVIGFYSVIWGKAKDEKIVAVLKTGG